MCHAIYFQAGISLFIRKWCHVWHGYAIIFMFSTSTCHLLASREVLTTSQVSGYSFPHASVSSLMSLSQCQIRERLRQSWEGSWRYMGSLKPIPLPKGMITFSTSQSPDISLSYLFLETTNSRDSITSWPVLLTSVYYSYL